jgi:hypothetical protein
MKIEIMDSALAGADKAKLRTPEISKITCKIHVAVKSLDNRLVRKFLIITVTTERASRSMRKITKQLIKITAVGLYKQIDEF